MIGPHAKVYPIQGSRGLFMVLTPTPKLKGWSYDIQDGHGKSYASGWSAGRERDAKSMAEEIVSDLGVGR
jgi:hypothetical protein